MLWVLGIGHIYHGTYVHKHGMQETVQRNAIPIVMLHLTLQGDT